MVATVWGEAGGGGRRGRWGGSMAAATRGG